MMAANDGLSSRCVSEKSAAVLDFTGGSVCTTFYAVTAEKANTVTMREFEPPLGRLSTIDYP